MAAICDDQQRLCLGLALWNGVDPILKERMFGVTGREGNQGEDAKEYWWYLDSTPTHSWMSWRYHYPCTEFPYEQVLAENGRRSRSEPEYELLDTGCFADGYWRVDVDYAKHSPDDVVMHVRVTNASSEPRTVHVLPTLWLRNTWSWDLSADRPQMRGNAVTIDVDHPAVDPMRMTWSGTPTPLFCEKETNTLRLYGSQPVTPYPKHGINDHVVSGAPTVNPQRRGTKAALWYEASLDPGATAEMYVRLYALAPGSATVTAGADYATRGASDNSDESADHGAVALITQRRKEADDFYSGLSPANSSPDQALVMRRRSPACSGRSSSTTSTWHAGSTATRASPSHRGSDGLDEITVGAICVPPTSSLCPMTGNTHG